MESQVNQNDKAKYISKSVLTGIGKGIGAFLLTGIIGFVLFILSTFIWFESIPMLILGLTILVSGFVAIIAGIKGGQNKYKELIEESDLQSIASEGKSDPSDIQSDETSSL